MHRLTLLKVYKCYFHLTSFSFVSASIFPKASESVFCLSNFLFFLSLCNHKPIHLLAVLCCFNYRSSDFASWPQNPRFYYVTITFYPNLCKVVLPCKHINIVYCALKMAQVLQCSPKLWTAPFFSSSFNPWFKLENHKLHNVCHWTCTAFGKKTRSGKKSDRLTKKLKAELFLYLIWLQP